MSCTDFYGFVRTDFTFEGRNAILVTPKTPRPDGKWLFKTEYFGAFPDFEVEMLKRGYYLAALSNHSRWVLDDDIEVKDRFCAYLTAQFGLAEQCVPVGMSCGGMHAVYFAARFPDRIAALYLDAPVLNLLSCPCGIGDATKDLYEEFVTHTGKTVNDLLNYRNHPVDHIDTLIANRIPVALVCGDSDKCVPYAENGIELSKKYRATDLPFFEVLKEGCDHHPHGIIGDLSPLIHFIEQHA